MIFTYKVKDCTRADFGPIAGFSINLADVSYVVWGIEVAEVILKSGTNHLIHGESNVREFADKLSKEESTFNKYQILE